MYVRTYILSSSFLGFTAQLRLLPPSQNPVEFLGGFSTTAVKYTD
jgi:hypothetical protein